MEPGEYLFISDLHLSAEAPETTELFLGFLADRARRARRLYILGDLFDAWVGDDDDTPMHRRIIDGLRRLSDAGVAVDLQHGNRDFLIGRRFARAAGCNLIKDPLRVELHGTATLLMHGDLLCSDDVPYQKFRRKVRNPLVQWLFLRRGLDERRAQAADYRRRSGEAKSEKTEQIMDVNQATVERYMRKYRVDRLIHGHTHRPGRHEVFLDGGAATRWVLGQWQDGEGCLLSLDAHDIRAERLG